MKIKIKKVNKYYRNEKYLVYKELNWWYCYTNVDDSFCYDNYVGMYKTRKAAFEANGLELEI